MKSLKSIGVKSNSFYTIKDIKLNSIKKFKIKISEKLHKDFIKFSGDNSPIHTDIKFCKKIVIKNHLVILS